jgi:hypothetical protein
MSESVIKTGGGTFDPREQHLYFIASDVGRLRLGAQAHHHLLVAVNELTGARDLEHLESWLDVGKRVFIDSGVYNLAMSYARQHTISMDTALSMPPQRMSGFEALLERYVTLIRRFESRLWGYIEIDQGGRENKIQTRARLEALGLRPIPVYHPLNDGWDYFDELAARYDRICFGNVVQADRATRVRLLATMWERHCHFPNLWIHVLGLTPNAWMNGYPSNSADSSSWLAGIRWAASMKERAMSAPVGTFPLHFRYRYGSPADAEDGPNKAVVMAGYWAAMIGHNWRNHLAALREAGLEVYPDAH